MDLALFILRVISLLIGMCIGSAIYYRVKGKSLYFFTHQFPKFLIVLLVSAFIASLLLELLLPYKV